MENESEKIKNFNDLIKGQKEFGWNLLRNQNDFIEVDGQKLNIIELKIGPHQDFSNTVI